jgi:hypothetical protein
MLCSYVVYGRKPFPEEIQAAASPKDSPMDIEPTEDLKDLSIDD